MAAQWMTFPGVVGRRLGPKQVLEEEAKTAVQTLGLEGNEDRWWWPATANQAVAQGVAAKWAAVQRRTRSGEWLMALPTREDKQGGARGVAGWPTAMGGTSAEAPHRCEPGHRGVTGQKAGTHRPSTGWNSYALFGLLRGEPRPTFQFLPKFQSAPTLKFKNTAFPRSKNTQTLHESRVEYDEQLSPLAELQIPTGFHVILVTCPWVATDY
jgi:hypothetical protein